MVLIWTDSQVLGTAAVIWMITFCFPESLEWKALMIMYCLMLEKEQLFA